MGVEGFCTGYNGEGTTSVAKEGWKNEGLSRVFKGELSVKKLVEERGLLGENSQLSRMCWVIYWFSVFAWFLLLSL